MQFYKLEGFTVAEKWSEGSGDRHAMRGKISMKTTAFYQRRQGSAYLFVAEAAGSMVTIGVIVRDSEDVPKLISEYLRAIDVELKDTCLEEITLNTLRHMLRCADRCNYIPDDNQVLEQFDLDKLDGGFGVEYGENILSGFDRGNIYAEAEKLLAKDAFLPELDRIFAGNAKKRGSGHPVHYMIQTDDREIRNGMYQTLLRALYANNRLHSKRYCFLDFRPGEDFADVGYDCLYKSSAGGAVVVRYLADDDTEDDYASGGRDTIESLCAVAKKYRHQVLTVFCLPRECTESKGIFYENLGNVSLVELKEEFVSGESAKTFLKMLAKENGVRADKRLFAKLEEEGGYLAPDLHNLFDEWYDSKLKADIYPQYKDIGTTKREIIKAAAKGAAYDELNRMIGLGEAKKVINRALDYYKAQKLFADKGMKRDRTAMHMVFTGNPGTAKTSVARLFARIMRENNLLSKGNLIEVARGDLVGKYVGWTAPIIQKKFKEAQGGVLFIDEAYSLVDDRNGSFGDEAINTIVQEMENHREDVVVILAGYPDKMEALLQKNPGLRSRIAYHVSFDDYDTESLCEIAGLIARQKGLTLTDEAYDKLAILFDHARTESDFGNGRFVRNVIEKAKMAQAARLLAMDFDSVRRKDISTICAADIEVPETIEKAEKKRIGFCA